MQLYFRVILLVWLLSPLHDSLITQQIEINVCLHPFLRIPYVVRWHVTAKMQLAHRQRRKNGFAVQCALWSCGTLTGLICPKNMCAPKMLFHSECMC